MANLDQPWVSVHFHLEGSAKSEGDKYFGHLSSNRDLLIIIVECM